jgi:hypothetical protein
VLVIFERTAPDGRRFVTSWVAQYGVWRVKFLDRAQIFQAPQLRDALVQAVGDAADHAWAERLAKEIQDATDAAARVRGTAVKGH